MLKMVIKKMHIIEKPTNARTYIYVSNGRAKKSAASPAADATPILLEIVAAIDAMKPASREATVTVHDVDALAEVVRTPNNASAIRK